MYSIMDRMKDTFEAKEAIMSMDKSYTLWFSTIWTWKHEGLPASLGTPNGCLAPGRITDTCKCHSRNLVMILYARLRMETLPSQT